MLFGTERSSIREMIFFAWKKQLDNLALEPLEQQICEQIKKHPEFFSLFSNAEKNLHQEYFVELGQTNPFMHIGLHLAIVDQLAVDQPKGIRALFTKLVETLKDPHEAEHCLMAQLVCTMTEVREKGIFDEQMYLRRITEAL